MKTLKTTIAAMMIMLTSLAASAQPMSVYAMRNNARFLTDRMAYTLGLSAALIDDLYYINYDYICGVNDYLDAVALGYRYDDYMEIVYARDYALRRLLTERQWALLMTYDYFYRPIAFNNHRWSFSIYLHDRRMDHFFYAPPRRFNDYHGGTVFGGMRRMDGPGMGPGRPGGPMPGGPMQNGARPGDVRPGNVVGPNNRPGDLRGEVIRQGNTPSGNNNQPYHFETTTPNNRGTVNNGPTTVNRQGGTTVITHPNNTVNNSRSGVTNVTPNTNTNVNRPSIGNVITNVNTNTRSTVTPVNRTPNTTVTSFPGSASRTTTPTTRSSAVTSTPRTTVSTPTRSSVTAPTRSSVTTPTRSSVSTPTRSSVSTPTRSSSGPSASRPSGGSASRVSGGRR